MKLKLKSGETFRIADGATPNRICIIMDGVAEEEIISCMTEENLSEIQFVTDDGKVTGVYRNQMLYRYREDVETLEVFIKDADLCRYGLTLDESNRIIYVVEQRYASADAIIVEDLPDGNYSDYLYVDGEYVYDPLPAPEQPEDKPTQEERITALENQLAAYEAAYAEGVNEA